jgi:anti-sigma28 factor (negative regulator of flagellin synthesis)
MNYPIGYEDHRDDRRQSSAARPFAPSAEITAMSRNAAAEAIAEDPAKLRLAGKLISWAIAGNAVRFEKVAALRQAIEAGTYRVSSADLAEKLMENMTR